MSRSYKKHPYSGDHKGKEKKRIANKRVRSYLEQNKEELLKGQRHRRIFPTYDICDFGGLWSWEEDWEYELQFYYDQLNGIFKYRKPEDAVMPNKKECYRNWYKRNKGK